MTRTSTLALGTMTLLALAGCDSKSGSASQQLGANPPLPHQKEYLLPPMHIAKPAPWGGAMPHVPHGMKVTAFASDLHNVRSVFALPNGDILAIQPKGPTAPILRPKDIIVNWIKGWGHSSVKGTDQIILLRDTRARTHKSG